MINFALGLILSSCGFLMVATTDIKSPKVKYLSHKIEKVTQEQVEVDLRLNAHNPNTIGLKNVFVSYELFTEGNKISKGEDIPLKLDPEKETVIKVPVKIMYKGVLSSLKPILKKLIKQKKTLPVEIRAVVYGKPTVYNNMAEGDLFSFSHKEKKLSKFLFLKQKIKYRKKLTK